MFQLFNLQPLFLVPILCFLLFLPRETEILLDLMSIWNLHGL